MKKLLLTLSAVLGVSAAAFGQGSLLLQDGATPDFGSVSITGTNANDATVSHYYTGSLTLEIFAVQNASLATLQADQSGLLADAANNTAAMTLLATDGFVQQSINGGSNIVVAASGGTFQVGSAATIGNSGTITPSGTTVNTEYVLYGGATIAGQPVFGILALNPSVTGAAAPGTPANMNSIWPGSGSQAFNLYLQPVPEPTTLALAGLGGLSMLFLRRRKV
jgi:hypothetical protein